VQIYTDSWFQIRLHCKWIAPSVRKEGEREEGGRAVVKWFIFRYGGKVLKSMSTFWMDYKVGGHVIQWFRLSVADRLTLPNKVYIYAAATILWRWCALSTGCIDKWVHCCCINRQETYNICVLYRRRRPTGGRRNLFMFENSFNILRGLNKKCWNLYMFQNSFKRFK